MNPCLEVAVYQALDPEGFDRLQADAHRALARYAGFVRGLALRGHEDAGLRADLIVWDGVAAAQAAADAMLKDPGFASFRAAIGEIRHFAHYRRIVEDALEKLEAGPFVEVAAYRGKADAEMDRLQHAVHAALPKVEGMVFAAAGARNGEPGHVDLIAWRDATAMKAAPPQIVARQPDVTPFFDSIDETFVFDLFEVVRGDG